MFDVPEAKRIKRSHFVRASSPIRSSRSTSGDEENSPSHADQNTLPHYTFEYDFIDVTLPTTTASDDNGDDKHTFEFRLFASTDKPTTTNSTTTAPTTAITILPSQDPSSIPLSKGRFIKPNRPPVYYFTSALPSTDLDKLREQYTTSAVSSARVIEKATTQSWPGTALPWRVIHLPPPSQPPSSKANPKTPPSLTDYAQLPSPSLPDPLAPARALPPSSKHRTKPSKKRRIQLRTRLTHRAQLSAAEKEAAQKEKRAAANRKNKLKRRERERRKKAEATAGGEWEAGMGREEVEEARPAGEDEERETKKG